MINNWDIISRIDSKHHSLRYTLVTDGTEHDARLIAKKLEGYVQQPQPAVAPFVYAFELPADLDEDTLEKIRTAVREGIEQTNKVNQFVPGGILGDPLFNAEVSKEDKSFPTFVTLDPSESFFRTPQAPENGGETPTPPTVSENIPTTPAQETVAELQAKHINLDEKANTLELEKQTVASAAPQEAAPQTEPSHNKEKSSEITISDKDMLIKDMEGTLLGQMPLEDILSAETKYDMFMDVANPQLAQNSLQQREQKMSSLADGKDSLEESFNIFEQKLKDQTCFVDLEDLNTITDRLSKKDTDFLKHAAPLAETPAAQPAAAPETAPAAQPQTDAPKEAAPAAQPQADATEGVEDPFEQIEKQALRQQTVSNLPAETDVPAGPAEEPQPAAAAETEEKEMDQISIPLADLQAAPAAEDVSSADAEQTVPAIEQISVKPAEQDNEPLNLGPAPEDASATAFEHTAPGELPEEVELLNTIAPGQHIKTPVSENANGDDLPEITIRGQKIDSLEKTFNLETTLNTEIMKHQYEKSFHDIQTPSASKPAPAAQPPAKHSAAPETTQKIKRTIFRLKGKKETASAPMPTPSSTNVYPGEPIMEENQEPKTTFRIKRKPEAAPQAPGKPAAPQQPAMPAAPAAPAAASAQPAPAKPAVPPQNPQPKPAAANTIIEKTKTIDHSIEIPLSELKKHNWPLEVPLVPTYTLETMVMSVNRFAHATAISVIENPGKLYNPLVLHGATGTGKTHFLNAMAYAFSKKYGQENIFMTNGVRLSRGIQRYVMEGNIEKFEKFMDTVKVLLIDDIHLLAINEQNRTHISRLLNKFLQDQKQIVITSKYPPESLEKLEELIKFKLDSGWISELKPASGATHLRIVKKMLLDNGVDLNDTQINAFFGGPHMTLGTVTRSIRRLKVLENLIFPHVPESERSQAAIFEKLLATNGEDANSEILSRDPESISAISMSGNGEWGRIGFFYPQNSSHMMNWMVYALQQRAQELGIEGSFEIAVRSSYATENIISSAFKIANLCDNKKLKGAVILGPALNVCDPSVRENFYDILTHMLEIMLIRCGIINFEDAKAPSTYVKVLSELLR